MINDQFSTGQPNYREFLYTLTDFSGWGQNFDGNGPFLRVQPGGGNLLVEQNEPEREPEHGQAQLRAHDRAAARHPAAARRSGRR